jgi:hypothetical protein
VASKRTKEESQFALLKSELELTQRQMDKYDQLSMQTKGWAITLWAVSVGWSFQVDRREVVFLSLVVVLMFWFFDALNKSFRQDYKKRRDEAGAALAHYFEHQSWPSGTVSPQLPRHRRADALQIFAAAHLALPYAILAVISLALYFGF